MSDLRIHYAAQNRWAQDLRELFSSGLNNQYLLQNDDAYNSWFATRTLTHYVVTSTDAFIINDMSFKEFYNFDKTYEKII